MALIGLNLPEIFGNVNSENPLPGKLKSMKTRLVLFDIDGTLLTTNGMAVESMLAAVQAAYGVTAKWDSSKMNGKTELWIVHKLLADAGVPQQTVGRYLPRMWSVYVSELERRLSPHNVTVFPGVRELLGQLAQREDILLGLLTGNIESSAKVKLGKAGLEGFALGAYGEHHQDRAALPGVAVEAAQRISGKRFAGGRITIIGDTPNDITCGAHLGVNAIAVATGRYGEEELRRHGPAHLFHDLSDTRSVLDAIESP